MKNKLQQDSPPPKKNPLPRCGMAIKTDRKNCSDSELRREAEFKVASQEIDITVPLSKLDEKRLLHELQVHQVELEMQNEELTRITTELLERETQLKISEKLLRENQNQLQLFIDYAPAAMAMFDRNMCYLRVNRRWVTDHGIKEQDIIGKSHYEVFPEIPDQWRVAHRRGLAGEDLRSDGDPFERIDGSVQWVRWQLRPWHDDAGTIGGIIIFTEDITEHKFTTVALKEIEKQFISLYEESLDAVFYAKLDGTILAANPAACRIFDMSMQELCRIGRSGIIDHDDFRFDSAQEMRDKTGQVFAELTCIRNSDERIPAEVSLIVIEHDPPRCFVIIRDITERKLAEKERIYMNDKVLALNEHIQSAIEHERLAISRDIHDDLGQELTILKLDLEWLAKRLPADSGDLHKRIIEMRESTNRFSATIQRIAANLRPPLLDEAGLIAAIEWHVSEYRKHSGLECFVMVNEDIEPLDDNTSTVVMRILQEGLTNASRHAKATEISISLCKKGINLILEVSDNGCGITAEQMASPQAYGLMGMQERARSCRGILEITGEPQCGTTLKLTIPLSSGECTV